MTKDKLIIPEEDNGLVLPFEKPKPHLKVLPGDRDPNWLAQLPLGTIFLAKPKMRPDVDLNEYAVMQKLNLTTQLQLTLPNSQVMLIWVETLPFSLEYRKVETIPYGNDTGTIQQD